MNKERIIEHLCHHLPGLMAIYTFGSRITGEARPDSDLDLAVLVQGYADTVALFDLAGELADMAACDVDLLDFRAASTVMQHQILTKGERWWARDFHAGLFEAAVLSEKLVFDESRKHLLADIGKRGSVYGR